MLQNLLYSYRPRFEKDSGPHTYVGKSNQRNSKNLISCTFPQALRTFLNVKMLKYFLRRGIGGGGVEYSNKAFISTVTETNAGGYERQAATGPPGVVQILLRTPLSILP